MEETTLQPLSEPVTKYEVMEKLTKIFKKFSAGPDDMTRGMIKKENIKELNEIMKLIFENQSCQKH